MTSEHQTASQEHDHATSAKPSPKPNYNNERIGDILRRVREHRQEDLYDIADYLCIRRAYLSALEDSRYDDLPAEAYVVGFLRTYALYLGLEGQGAIEQYRREMAGRSRQPNLAMPQPVPEGRAPTVALLAGAAVAAIIIYGLWYGLSTPDEEVTNQPIPLPKTEAELSSAEDIIPVPKEIDAKKTEEAKEEKETAEGKASSLLQETTSPGITLSVSGHDETALPAEAKKRLGALVITSNGTSLDKAKPVQDENVKEVAAAPEKPKETKQKSFGYKGTSHVSIRADKKSWILITDKKGLTIFDRTLNKGETYRVRANKSRRLTTGNASGLTFIVDGKPLPKMKSKKRVIRAVDLSPSNLKDLLD